MRTLRAAGPVALGQATGAAAIFLLGVVTARHLGPEGRGVFAATTFAAVLAGSGSLSVVPAVAYFDPRRLGVLACIGLAIGLVVGAIIGAYLYVTDAHGSAALAPVVPSLYAMLVVPVAVASGRFLGGGSTAALGVLFGLGPVLQLGGVVAAIWLGADGPGELLVGWISGFAVLALVVLARLPRGGTRSPSARELTRYSIAATGTNLLWALGARAELFVLAGLATATEVGVYSISLAPAQVLTVLASAYATAVYARMRRGGRAVLPKALGDARRLGGLSLLVAGVLAASSSTLIPLIYGDAFDPSVGPALILLCAGAAVAPVAVLNAYFTNALGRPGLASALGLAGLVVTVAVAALLIPSQGAAGAAWGSLAGSLSVVGAAVLAVRWAASPPATAEPHEN